MFSANCPNCNIVIRPDQVNSKDRKAGLGNITCPHCNSIVTMSKRSKLWMLSTLTPIPVCIVSSAIEGNSNIDNPIEYTSIAISVIGLLGLIATYKYEKTDS